MTRRMCRRVIMLLMCGAAYSAEAQAQEQRFDSIAVRLAKDIRTQRIGSGFEAHRFLGQVKSAWSVDELRAIADSLVSIAVAVNASLPVREAAVFELVQAGSARVRVPYVGAGAALRTIIEKGSESIRGGAIYGLGTLANRAEARASLVRIAEEEKGTTALFAVQMLFSAQHMGAGGKVHCGKCG